MTQFQRPSLYCLIHFYKKLLKRFFNKLNDLGWPDSLNSTWLVSNIKSQHSIPILNPQLFSQSISWIRSPNQKPQFWYPIISILKCLHLIRSPNSKSQFWNPIPIPSFNPYCQSPTLILNSKRKLPINNIWPLIPILNLQFQSPIIDPIIITNSIWLWHNRIFP